MDTNTVKQLQREGWSDAARFMQQALAAQPHLTGRELWEKVEAEYARRFELEHQRAQSMDRTL